MNPVSRVHAVVFPEPQKIELRELALGPCSDDELIVRTRYTMVSPGTELRVLGGHYGATGKFPLVPGYSVVGEVVHVGSNVRGWRVGDRVSGRNPKPLPGVSSMWGGQASHHVYPITGEDRPILLPEDGKWLDYAIVEISAISLRGVEAARPRAGETAVVIGQGMIGAFSAAWLAAAGCRVCVVDLEPARLTRAIRAGAACAFNASEPDLLDRLNVFTNGGADIVVEASGAIPGVELAYKILRRKPQRYGADYKVEPIQFYHGDWPRLIMQANYLDPISHNPHAFTPGEGVTILSPQDRGVEDRQRALELVRRGRIDPKHFIDAVIPAGEAPQAYRDLQSRKHFSVIFDWSALT